MTRPWRVGERGPNRSWKYGMRVTGPIEPVSKLQNVSF